MLLRGSHVIDADLRLEREPEKKEENTKIKMQITEKFKGENFRIKNL